MTIHVTSEQLDLLTALANQPTSSVPWHWMTHRETDLRALEALGLVDWVPSPRVDVVARWAITEKGREVVQS